MGYTHLTDISQFVPPSAAQKTGGTWTPTLASNVLSDVRTAAAAEFTMIIPLELPGSQVALQGAKIISVDLWYRIATASPTTFNTVSLIRQNMRGQELIPQGAAIAITLDGLHDTSDKRKTVDHHKMTITVDAPIFCEKNRPYYIVLTMDAHANTVFSYYGCQINYTLRL